MSDGQNFLQGVIHTYLSMHAYMCIYIYIYVYIYMYMHLH